MADQNTFYDFLNTLFKKTGNLYGFVTLLQESFASDQDTVTMSFEKDDGTVEEIEVGSVASVLRRVKNLEGNLENITNLSNLSNASILGSDGSLKKVFNFERSGEPKTFKVGNISSYFKRENYLRHLLVDPYVYLKIPLDKKDYPSYEKILVNKIVLNLGDADQVEYFRQNILDQEIEYDTMEQILSNGNISWQEVKIESKVETSMYSRRGVFDVLDITNKGEISGETGDQTVYLLNTLFYTDISTNTQILLRVGDRVFVRDTEYEVNYVSQQTNHIGLIRVSGYEPVTLGLGKIKYLNTSQEPHAGVPINKDEFLIVFVKPINPSTNIVSQEWGTGKGVETNQLLGGEQIKDLWKSVEAVANESLVPAKDFIKPQKPILERENFNTVVVNDHREITKSVGEVKQLFSNRIQVESNLKMVQDEILKVNKDLATSPPTDNSTKNKLRTRLESLRTKEINVSQELQSRTNELNVASIKIRGFKPKRHVQGFIKAGAEAFDGQKVLKTIGFETEYRYLNLDGTAKENESVTIDEDGFQKKGVVPKWIKMPIPKIREKDTDGNWLEEDESSIDEQNINQIDIPISKGEIVEIRTRAISEAGYPLQMNYSDWSDPLQIELGDEEEDDVEELLDKSSTTLVFNRLIEDLSSRGVLRHNEDSLEITEKYYAHFLKNIGTSILSPENKPLDAETILLENREDIRSIQNILNQLEGQISVRLLNEDESVIANVEQNNTIRFTDEYYRNLVEDATVRKGEVVDRTMYIEITNLSDGDIEILPFVTGIDDDPLVGNYTGYTFNNTEYNDFRKYNRVPLSRLDVQQDSEFLQDRFDGNVFREIEDFQSKQVKGQLLYSRKRDIRLTNELWDDSAGSNIPTFSATNPQAFIWNGSQTTSPTPNGNGGLTDFCVHIDHPDIQNTSFMMQNWGLYHSSGVDRTLPQQTFDSNRVYYPLFVHSQLASDPNSVKQLAYVDYTPVQSNADISNFPAKTRFSPNDKYLIGKETCGLYLTLATIDQMFTNISFAGESKKVKRGDRVLIPIVASSRLTDYFGVGNTGTGRIGGDSTLTNISYKKKIGIDMVVKRSRLELPTIFSFDFQYEMKYEKSSIN